MNTPFAQSALADKVAIHVTNFDLPANIRAAAFDQAARLLASDERIDRIRLDFEATPATPEAAPAIVLKGAVEFGGPALLASVTSSDAATALEFLIDKLDRMLRRGRAARPVAVA